jgi:hypothetical protein
VPAAHLGTPRERYDEHSGKFSLSMKPRFNRTSRRKKSLLKVDASWLGDSSRQFVYDAYLGVALVTATMWNLHTTQPKKYFAPTCSEVVNLIGLL